jgi:hypothetical protein
MQALAEIDGHQFEHLRDHFPEGTKDPVWLRELGRQGGWIVLSGDTRISRSPVEKAAWHESNLTVFFFSEPFPNTNYWAQTAELVAWWPEIARQAKRTPTGHGFMMPKKGKALRQIYP